MSAIAPFTILWATQAMVRRTSSVRYVFVSTFIAAVVAQLGVLAAYGQQVGDLSQLATVNDRTSHRASSFDVLGANSDNIEALAPGEIHTVLDTAGPGKITHLWLTVSNYNGHQAMLHDIVVKMYWEGSSIPSVEVPLGDFFGLGHGKEYKVHSAPINVGSNTRALNCYWPMPFYKHARIELVNTGQRSIRRIYYNVDYELGAIAENQGLFHANYRRVRELASQPMEANTHGEDNYVLLDTVGKGQYLGCFLYVDSAPGGWWGEGDEMIFIDGETKPSIVGTGTEDYFGNAWGFDGVANHPFYGVPFLQRLADGWTQTAVYRLHVPDPVRFDKGIRVTLEHSWPGDAKYDYSSVAYWYQTQPVSIREPLLSWEENRPRTHTNPNEKRVAATKDICGTEFEPVLRQRGVNVKAVTTGHRQTFGGGYLAIEPGDRFVELPINGLLPGKYRVSVAAISNSADVVAKLNASSEVTLRESSSTKLHATLGMLDVRAGETPQLWLRSKSPIHLDEVKLELVKE